MLLAIQPPVKKVSAFLCSLHLLQGQVICLGTNPASSTAEQVAETRGVSGHFNSHVIQSRSRPETTAAVRVVPRRTGQSGRGTQGVAVQQTRLLHRCQLLHGAGQHCSLAAAGCGIWSRGLQSGWAHPLLAAPLCLLPVTVAASRL